MPGALSGSFAPGYGDNGAAPQPPPQQQQPGYGAYVAASNPDAINDPYVDASIAGGGGGGSSSPYADQQAQFAAGLRGPTSPLQQYQQLSATRDSAAQQKMAAIQRAMNILQAAQGNQSTNLPMLAAASAMLAPTKTGTFSESLGRAFGAAVPATEQDRQRQWQENEALASLGVQSDSIPLETSQADMQDFFQRMKLSEEAGQGAALVGGRTQNAQIAAGSRQDVANTNLQARIGAAKIAAGARIDWAQINANKAQWKYLGLDPNNPDQGWYLNQQTGSMNPGPAVNPKQSQGADPSRIREAQALVQRGIAPDFGSAYGMVRFGANDDKSAAQFTREVQSEKRLMQQTPQGMTMTDAELENHARENVISRNQYHEQQGSGASGQAAPPAAPQGAPQQAPKPGLSVNPPKGWHNDPSTGGFAKDAPGQAAVAPPPPHTEVPVGATATNPQTGARVQWDGSTWAPVAQAPSGQ